MVDRHRAANLFHSQPSGKRRLVDRGGRAVYTAIAAVWDAMGGFDGVDGGDKCTLAVVVAIRKGRTT